jgi:hypothetical protein
MPGKKTRPVTRLWGPLQGKIQSISDPVLNDTQSVRAHKQMRSMVEVAFLDRSERGRIKTMASRSGRGSRPEWHGGSIANHKLLGFPMLSSQRVARVCSWAGLAW